MQRGPLRFVVPRLGFALSVWVVTACAHRPARESPNGSATFAALEVDRTMVAGRVRSAETGCALSHAFVRLIGVGETLADTTRTDTAGVFVFPRVAPGRYVIDVRRIAFTAARAELEKRDSAGIATYWLLRTCNCLEVDNVPSPKRPWWKFWR